MLRGIIKKFFGKKPAETVHTFEQLVELGHLSNFHGNNKVKNITIGKYSYVSFNSIVYHADIGSYCSIGPNVVIGYGDHPTDLISTSPHIYLNEIINTAQEVESRLVPHFRKVKIGNDVWIGANVYIKNGVKVGNGAVIGTGSVVLKDVHDYEIVAGVPAKVIRKRFSDEVIHLLLKLKWWELEIDELAKYKNALDFPTKDNLTTMVEKISKND